MPIFTNSWHSRHAPVWETVVLPPLPNEKRRWIEIGEIGGPSATWTLENALRDGAERLCCDIWPKAEVEKLFDKRPKVLTL